MLEEIGKTIMRFGQETQSWKSAVLEAAEAVWFWLSPSGERPHREHRRDSRTRRVRHSTEPLRRLRKNTRKKNGKQLLRETVRGNEKSNTKFAKMEVVGDLEESQPRETTGGEGGRRK